MTPLSGLALSMSGLMMSLAAAISLAPPARAAQIAAAGYEAVLVTPPLKSPWPDIVNTQQYHWWTR